MRDIEALKGHFVRALITPSQVHGAKIAGVTIEVYMAHRDRNEKYCKPCGLWWKESELSAANRCRQHEGEYRVRLKKRNRRKL